MMWIAIATIVVVVIICECITDCVSLKYKEQECWCDSCPMQNECWEAMGNDR